MSKPQHSAILATIWAVVLVLAAVFFLSESGEVLPLVYQQGGWFGLLVGLYFFVRLSASAIFAVRRSVREDDPQEPDHSGQTTPEQTAPRPNGPRMK